MEDETLYEVEALHTRQDFERFLSALIKNLKSKPDDWDNDDLLSFLEAMKDWTHDAQGYYNNFNLDVDIEKPSWRFFADILRAARVYS